MKDTGNADGSGKKAAAAAKTSNKPSKGPATKAGSKKPLAKPATDPAPTVSKAQKRNKKKKQGGQQKVGTGNAASGRDFSTDLEAYCTQWAQARESWRFNKVLQTWALEHCMDRARISKTLFKTLLPYLASIQGGAKERLLYKVDKIIEDGFKPDEKDDEEGATLHSAEAAENFLKRAVKIKTALG